MINRWNYNGLGEVQYGGLESYKIACKWLDDVGGTVVDLGCGTAFAKRFLPHCVYTGVDGSRNAYADLCGVDLEHLERLPQLFDCVLLRHVLDHNVNWRKILTNAMTIFRKRMSLVFFRPFGKKTRVLTVSNCPLYPGVPDLEFCRDDFLPLIAPYVKAEIEVQRTSNPELLDTIFLMEKTPCESALPLIQAGSSSPSDN